MSEDAPYEDQGSIFGGLRLSKEDKAKLGITEGLIRCSVGLEDVRDLIADFKQAAKKSLCK